VALLATLLPRFTSIAMGVLAGATFGLCALAALARRR
jgi:hypothetical protein